MSQISVLEEPTNRSFGRYIDDLVTKRGLSVSALAQELGISRTAFYKLKRHGLRDSKFLTVINLARVLRVHPVELMHHGSPEYQTLTPSGAKAKYPGDDTRFVRDVTIPDNDTILTGSIFEKTWEIRNAGSVSWEKRRLVCIDEEIFLFRKQGDLLIPLVPQNLIPIKNQVPIPETKPGKTAQISVQFRAPEYPCTTISYWKMVDQDEDLCFPTNQGVWCQVRVVNSLEEVS